MSSPHDDVDRPGGPRRWGLAFAAIWLFYLLSPLAAAWDERDSWQGWLGIVGHPALRGGLPGDLRRPCAGGAPGRRSPLRSAVRAGLGLVLLEIALGVVMCVAIGQEGTAAAVYVAVTCVMCLQTRWAWLVAVTVGLAAYAATIVVPGWHRDAGILFGTLVATLAVWGISPGDQPQHRGAAGPRGERPARARRRAQPLRPRPARHPRPLADRDHGQGRARQPPDRRRPGARPGRARRPRAALARRAGRRTPCRRRLPRADPARRARPGPDGAVGRRDRGRPAQLHRRRADRPARAVRLDGPRGDHQRDPPQRRAHAAPCCSASTRSRSATTGAGPRRPAPGTG